MPGRKTSDRDYIYLSALLRARETKMLTGEVRNGLIDAPGFDAAARLLSGHGYPDMSGMGPRSVASCLSRRRKAELDELECLTPEREVVGIFRMRFDYHNAKVLIKRGGESGLRHLLVSGGRFSPETLEDSFASGCFWGCPREFADAVLEAKSVLRRTESPRLADFVLDRAYYTELSLAARRVSSPFLKSFVAHMADSVNIGVCVRAARTARDLSRLEKALVPGGSRDERTLARAALRAGGLEALFEGTALYGAASTAEPPEEGLTGLELERGRAMELFLESTRYVPFGTEAVVAYLARFEAEITAVRAILTGKLYGQEPEKLRERLCGAYV